MDVAYSAILQFAAARFDQLAAQLADTLRTMPAEIEANAPNLLAEYRRDAGDANPMTAAAWASTLDAILAPMIEAIPLPERRVLYLATDNGGDECVRLEDAEDIPLTGPWIQEEILRRCPVR
jgi:hypothetical protein